MPMPTAVSMRVVTPMNEHRPRKRARMTLLTSAALTISSTYSFMLQPLVDFAHDAHIGAANEARGEIAP